MCAKNDILSINEEVQISMEKTLDSIFERYSCRDFTGMPVTDGQIKMLANAALAAPSAMNRQPWHVIVITDKALIDEFDAAGMDVLANAEDKSTYERIMSRGGKIFYNCPCMVMVASDGTSFAAMDCGILSQNVALAAHALGLGSVICGMAGIPLSGPRGDEFKKRMKFPPGYGFGIAILVGEAKSGKEPHELDWGKVTYI
jgi:nitroreductase